MSISRKILKESQIKFGLNLKKLRLEKKLSQLDLAVKCNYEKTTISRIENGRTNITLKTALSLSESLEVNLTELFNF